MKSLQTLISVDHHHLSFIILFCLLGIFFETTLENNNEVLLLLNVMAMWQAEDRKDPLCKKERISLKAMEDVSANDLKDEVTRCWFRFTTVIVAAMYSVKHDCISDFSFFCDDEMECVLHWFASYNRYLLLCSTHFGCMEDPWLPVLTEWRPWVWIWSLR